MKKEGIWERRMGDKEKRRKVTKDYDVREERERTRRAVKRRARERKGNFEYGKVGKEMRRKGERLVKVSFARREEEKRGIVK